MAGYSDLDPLTYFGEDASPALRAIGWLDIQLPFPTGPTPGPVYSRLLELLRDPFQPFLLGGPHLCNNTRSSTYRRLFLENGGRVLLRVRS